MNELTEWPKSLLVATVCYVGALITLPIAVGCLTEPGWGWLALFVECAFHAKQFNDVYQQEKEQAKERNLEP